MKLTAIRLSLGARLACVLIAASVAVAGCTSMHRVPIVAAAEVPAPPPAKPGDNVRVTLRDGTMAEFIVGKVTTDAIVARNGDRYGIADIAILERRQFSGRRTILLILGVPAAVMGLAMLAFAAGGK